MSNIPPAAATNPEPETPNRCPQCDTVIVAGASHCAICGAALPATTPAEPASAPPAATPEPPAAPAPPPPGPDAAESEAEAEAPPIFESLLRERQAPVMFWLTAVFVGFIVAIGALILQNPVQVTVALFPTPTPLPPTITHTPTWTPYPTDTLAPTDSPTITPTPLPTDTPQPPRSHVVAANETLFGLSLRYDVSAGSIAEANELAAEGQIQLHQTLLIPWPTATPPLVAIAVEIAGETLIVDPAGCELYGIERGDNLFAIAARNRIPLEALQRVNRLTDDSIIRPGDTLCIPNIIRGGVLPPTPGPSPTPAPTLPPAGPHLLYPARQALITPPEGPVVLQWVAVKDLEPAEWYMVEVTNLTLVDSHPRRGFTRQTSLALPASWRAPVPEEHTFRWRVSIVQVTGRRSDGAFIYTYGGQSSQDAFFTWLGAVPPADG
jgi:LysM repeat protein